jgi:hypothetical protein
MIPKTNSVVQYHTLPVLSRKMTFAYDPVFEKHRGTNSPVKAKALPKSPPLSPGREGQKLSTTPMTHLPYPQNWGAGARNMPYSIP